MKLNYEIYKDKVRACWIGKNIGGTLGGPYEGVRKKLNVTGFATKAGEPLPNDDLDLQLIWFHAMKKEGPKNVTAEVLGDYWLSFIPVFFGEYEFARRNMEIGITPPMSGETDNNYFLKHSNGAWIRTEIWACLCPAWPDLAARYSIEDAKMDHGLGEGTYAAMFVAALESAAFVISDVRKLVEIGLSKIPADCRMARTIRLLLKCYDEGMPAMDARDAILNANYDLGDGWFSAPSNVGFAMLGILYGEGDFKKSMLTAINCGDDTDCTAATVGSILGIMYGTAGIPKDWQEYIGDKIITICINRGTGWPAIGSCSQLTDEVVEFAPIVLFENRAPFANRVEIVHGEQEVSQEELDSFTLPYGQSEESEEMARSVLSLKTPNTITKKCGPVISLVSVDGGAAMTAGAQKKLTISFQNRFKSTGNQAHIINVKLILPEGWTASNEDFDIFVPSYQSITENTCHSVPVEVTLQAPEKISAITKILVLVSGRNRYHVDAIPVVLLNRPAERCYVYPERFKNYKLDY